MEPSKTLDQALSQLGKQLVDLDWAPEGGTFVPFNGEDGDEEGEFKFIARAFVRKCKKSLKTVICKPSGGVRTGVKVGPDLVSFASSIALQEFGVEVDVNPMVEVFLHINFEVLCATGT